MDFSGMQLYTVFSQPTMACEFVVEQICTSIPKQMVEAYLRGKQASGHMGRWTMHEYKKIESVDDIRKDCIFLDKNLNAMSFEDLLISGLAGIL